MSARPFTFRETCTQTQMPSSFISHASTGEAAPCQEIIAAESAANQGASAVMTEAQDYLMDGSPLITAAHLGKLRLVRLLVEGGAQVNERNQRGETPLLAACRALRGEQSGTTMLRMIKFLLHNHADPNIQDKTGRAALMYACMERAGVEVAATLVAAGADPSLEDYSGASALVYAVNAQHQDTLQVLLDACRAKGRDILIIATDLNCDGSSVTRRYLNVLPSPDASPVSCMSPSDIELKTTSPNSDGENIFNFRGAGASSPVLPRGDSAYRQRLHSEPWLAIHNLAHLTQTYEKNLAGTFEGRDLTFEEDQTSTSRGFSRTCRSKKMDLESKDAGMCSRKPTENPSGQEHLQSRRNTLPDLQSQAFLKLPSVKLTLSSSDTHLHEPPNVPAPTPASIGGVCFPSIYRTRSLLLAPPDGLHDCKKLNKKKTRDDFSTRPESRRGFLPPLPVHPSTRTVSRDPNSHVSQIRRHSVQLEQTRQTGASEETTSLT
ncbi:ankyrin repeat domain-containing protein 34B [Triplophysa dalaica]|uniref:ankyrin repeat domain-containing protein 34B n=1 Tax=Triplophysa dalaica TaxID=1582913 RepID=UPI0024DFC405|nr:ankyrin repeat domain-containing protein 34B [Triplophysa dalaica]